MRAAQSHHFLCPIFDLTFDHQEIEIGPFVGLVTCIGATLLLDNPFLGALTLILLIALYAGIGAMIHTCCVTQHFNYPRFSDRPRTLYYSVQR